MKQLVSAIITTKNRLELLKRAVISVLNQSYSNIELVIVDDGSDDDTCEWCHQLVKQVKDWDSNIKVKYIRIPLEKSKGGNYARNLGIHNSTGEFIAFLDDDDYWLKNKIELQIDAFSNPDIGIVFGNRINEIVEKDGSVHLEKMHFNETIRGDLSKVILGKIVTSTSLIIVRRNIIEQIGGFDENLKFWQEYELLIRIAQVTQFAYTPNDIVVYRIDKNDSKRLTNKYYGWKTAVKYIHKKHESLYKKLNFDEKLRAKALVWIDAQPRCLSAGLKLKATKFKIMTNCWRLYNSLRSGTLYYKLKSFFILKRDCIDV